MAFPATSVLDSFNRADEGPPPSSSWTNSVISTSGGMKVVSNTAMCNAAGVCSGWWNVSTFGPDCEAYATFGATVRLVNIYVRLASPGVANNTDGYLAIVGVSGSTTVHRVDDSVNTQLGAAMTTPVYVTGDKGGVEMIGSTLTLWSYQGSWSSIDTRSDGTYTAAGNIGFGGQSTAGVWDDFGGGSIGTAPVVQVPITVLHGNFW